MSFLFPGFLALGAFVMLPVWLHLSRRERPVPRDFPSLRYFQKAPLPRQKKNWPTDLLLLLLRCLILASAVLLLSRPFFPTAPLGETPAEKKWLILADRTASTAQEGFEEKREIALQDWIEEEGVESFGWLPVPLDDASDLPETYTREDLDRLLLELEPAAVKQRWESEFGQLENWIQSQGYESIVLLSDFSQGEGWATFESLANGGLEWVVLPSGNPVARPNAGIQVVDIFPGPPDEDNPNKSPTSILRGQVHFSGFVDSPDFTLLFSGDGVERRETISTNQSPASFAFYDLPGELDDGSLKIEVEGDVLPMDDLVDLRWSAPVAREVPLFIPAIDEPGSRVEIQFLEAALQARPAGAPASLAPLALDYGFIGGSEWNASPAWILYGVTGYLEDEARDAVQNYLINGGRVIVFPGDLFPETLSWWSRLAGERLEYQGFFGDREADLRRTPFIGRFDRESYPGSLFQESSGDLFEVGLRRFFVISHQTSDASSVRTLLGTEENEPLLLRFPVGKGEVNLFTFRANRRDSDFPVKNVFLPWMAGLVEGERPTQQFQASTRSSLEAGANFTPLAVIPAEEMDLTFPYLPESGSGDLGPAQSGTIPPSMDPRQDMKVASMATLLGIGLLSFFILEALLSIYLMKRRGNK